MAVADNDISDLDATELTDYVVVCGHVQESPALMRKFSRAALLTRLTYNACIDRHVSFEEGVRYRLALAGARRLGLKEPELPEKSSKFLPVPYPQDLSKALTRLRAEHEQLRSLPHTMLSAAIDSACVAVKKHVSACVVAKQSGRKFPTLHWRSTVEKQR